MDKLILVKELLKQLDMPIKQQSNICCLTLLSMAKLRMQDKWKKASNDWLRIHDVIAFIAENYNITYAENSRETFRKQAMHPFRTAAIIEDNGVSTNSPNYRYRITPEFLTVISSINEKQNIEDNKALKLFLSKHDTLSKIYASKRMIRKIPVKT